MRHLTPFALLLLAWLPIRGEAATITVTFSGTIDEVGSEIASGFTAGDPFSGSFQIDSTAADGDASSTLGSYGPIQNLAFTFGSYAATAPSSGLVSVRNDSFDSFVASSFNATGASVGGLALVEATLNLVDSSATALSSDALPASLSLGSFSFARALLWFEGGLTSRRVAGNVASLTYTVPEPATLALLALGGLLILRRGR